MRRSCALALGLTLAWIAPVVPAEEAALERFENAVAQSAGESLVPGAEGTVVTVLEGNRRREIPLTYLGTYRDFSGPGYDLHLVQLEGPDADRVGVAAGMSGSPVYFGGKMIGALAYRLGFMPKTAVAGVTPIEDILDAAREAPRGEAGDASITPIATPVVARACPRVRGSGSRHAWAKWASCSRPAVAQRVMRLLLRRSCRVRRWEWNWSGETCESPPPGRGPGWTATASTLSGTRSLERDGWRCLWCPPR